MAKSSATTVEGYLAELTPDRRESIAAVRAAIIQNLPTGYEETMQGGMIAYVIPLEDYPVTYNRQPLVYAQLASQKAYMSVYLMNIYGDKQDESWFVGEYEAAGKKLDMGKSCVRFKSLDDLPVDVIGKAIALTPVAEFIERYEAVKGRPGRGRAS